MELERLDRTTVHEGAVVDFCRDTVRLPDGRVEAWDFIRHRKGGGACVVAVTKDGKIVMVRQKRPCVDRWFWELPAGAKDAGEDAGTTAGREFLEETGYRASSLRRLFGVYSAPAWCDETTDIFLAEDVEKAGSQKLDEAEDIRVGAFPPEELVSMIFAGEITDAKTVAGILAYSALTGRKDDGAK